MTEHRRITVRGAEIAYEREGTGPDLIWGHGLGSSRAHEATLGFIDWHRVGARVLRYDARGHGESETTADLEAYRWSELALDQLALADALHIERFVAAGASMGCGTALHLAVHDPSRLRALVLVIPPTAWEQRAAQAETWLEGARLVAEEGLEALVRAQALRPLADPFVGDPHRLELVAAGTRTWEPGRLATVLAGAARADLPSREEIGAIDCPTLLLAWSGDPVHPLSTAEELHGLIAGSRLVVARDRSGLDCFSGLIADFVADLAGD